MSNTLPHRSPSTRRASTPTTTTATRRASSTHHYGYNVDPDPAAFDSHLHGCNVEPDPAARSDHRRQQPTRSEDGGDIKLGPSDANGGSGTSSNNSGDDRDDEKLWSKQHLWTFVMALLNYALLADAYILANPYFKTTAGLWTMLFYALLFSCSTTLISMMLFERSRSVMAVFLRVIFLIAAVSAEVTVAITVCSHSPESKLAKFGSTISVVHLVVVYAIGWYVHCR